MVSTLGRIIKKGYEEILERKISDDERDTIMSKVSRDNFRRVTECKKRETKCKRVELTKEYLESLLREKE